MLKQIKAITLLELMVVVIIIGVLATLGLPKFGAMRERALDKEAKANLKLIQAAEKIYRMEIGHYYPGDASTPATLAINTNLRLDLSVTNWAFQTDSPSDDGSDLSVTAARNNAPAGWARTYYIDEHEEEACCCPQTSVCPTQDQCTGCPPPPY